MKSFKLLAHKKGKEKEKETKNNTSKPAAVNLKYSIQQKYLSEMKGKESICGPNKCCYTRRLGAFIFLKCLGYYLFSHVCGVCYSLFRIFYTNLLILLFVKTLLILVSRLGSNTIATLCGYYIAILRRLFLFVLALGFWVLLN